MDNNPFLTVAQGSAVTGICSLNALLILGETYERIFITKKQEEGSPYATVGTQMWQHPDGFYYLWFQRGVIGIIACLLPIAPMWLEFFLRQKPNNNPGYAVAWATSGLIACIACSMLGEVRLLHSRSLDHVGLELTIECLSKRILYLGFTDSFNPEQIACTAMTLLGVALIILGELKNIVPVPIAWTITGCALHRLSMMAWWYAVTTKTFTTRRFKARARLMLAGQGLALACVFLVFLPEFQVGLNKLFTQWLFAIFAAVEIITTAKAVGMTYSNWATNRARRNMPPASPPDIDIPMRPLSAQAAQRSRIEVRSSIHQEDVNWRTFLKESNRDPLNPGSRTDVSVHIYSPPRAHKSRRTGRQSMF
ncbi:hypothetical protein CONLIGDRAFT_700103 [Coniochaeta ligniaria NRRL 30616]|uniref:Uncharacterized protein n=1 Tax=Coniochaeta ligniaria NRRL 30616 TaxID=1408157 RepID=A0A1J7JL44_9PEZI|nr:hypothetical protein CONLIGDRAFT_700103 [Coniochaeta ligniaria NRRL 30616]